ncbi:MAG: ABC transporter permease [Myxococcales bacterium]|nr:ABC transporter permease [Myxococcales bacterium]
MMRRVWALALNTFRDAIRHRVLYGILAVVFAVNLFAIVLGEMSLHQEARVARDLGLGGVSLFGSITAIFLGVSLLYTEIKKRTIHTIVTKPLERYEFVLGKYLGMVVTLVCLLVLFSVVMLSLLWLQDVGVTTVLIKALLLAFFEVLVVAAIAVFFSSFSSPFLSGIFTFGIFYLGRVTPDLRAVLDSAGSSAVQGACNVALFVVPDLHIFSVSGGSVDGNDVSVHGDFVSWGYMGMASGYAVLYIGILMGLSIFIFSRRDFV